MKYLSTFVLFSLLFILATNTLGKADSASESGRFVTLTHGYGKEFHAFIASPANAKARVLVVAGAEESDATQSAINFFSNMRQVNRPYEMLMYPGADHGYAQPLFNEGKNYNAEAVRATWVLVDDFLSSALSHDVQPSSKA